MTKPVKRFLILASILTIVHFCVLCILGWMQASALSAIVDGTYEGSLHDVRRFDQVAHVLTFPLQQLLAPPQVVGSPESKTVAQLAPFVFPASSILWGCLLALIFERFSRSHRKDTESNKSLQATSL